MRSGGKILLTLLLLASGVVFTQSASAQGPEFDVCYDFSCRSKSRVVLNRNEWSGVSRLFFPPAASPAEERKQIQRAVGLMEVMAGKYTPTYRDVARNSETLEDLTEANTGQLDCVDEAINTTTYLRLFETAGLIRFHKVLDKAYRRALLNQHWAAEVVDNISGESFIIDSWFRDNGEPPYVVRGEDWRNLSIFRRRARAPKRVDVSAREVGL